MTLTAEFPKTISLAEFLILPETKPAREYINGKIHQKPMPQGKHSTLQIRLGSAINQVSVPEQIAHAFTELRCTFGGRSLVPDIAVFEWDNIPLDENGEVKNRFELFPDWIIEIVSPNQTDVSIVEKILFCLAQGTKLGWIVDPQNKLVIIFQPDRQPEVKRNDEILTVLPVLDHWQLSANKLFQFLTFQKNS
ncbi:MAG: Uma2 family endonuclease [Cyanobacteriota bacterium]|nr:Uma2 family endonuclease [Cyanobacteriota bacterium]